MAFDGDSFFEFISTEPGSSDTGDEVHSGGAEDFGGEWADLVWLDAAAVGDPEVADYGGAAFWHQPVGELAHGFAKQAD